MIYETSVYLILKSFLYLGLPVNGTNSNIQLGNEGTYRNHVIR